VRKASYRTVVARGQDGLVTDDDGADMLSVARAPGADLRRYLHEVRVPVVSSGPAGEVHLRCHGDRASALGLYWYWPVRERRAQTFKT